MRIILCVLLAASVASAQIVRGNTVSNTRPDTTFAANPTPAAAPAPAPAAAGGAGAPAAGGAAPAGTAGGAAGAAGGAARPAGHNFGPAFFGPGLNNPLAFPPNMFTVRRAQQVARANPNVRVFVDVDGTVEFTDEFGREVEIVDQFGFDALEPIDPQEQQQLLLQSRQTEFQRRRLQLEQQLLQEFGLAQGGNAFAAPQPGAPGQVAQAPQQIPQLQRNFRIAL